MEKWDKNKSKLTEFFKKIEDNGKKIMADKVL